MSIAQKQLNVRVPEDLHKALKIRAAEEGKTVQDVMIDAARLYLRRGRAPKRLSGGKDK